MRPLFESLPQEYAGGQAAAIVQGIDGTYVLLRVNFEQVPDWLRHGKEILRADGFRIVRSFYMVNMQFMEKAAAYVTGIDPNRWLESRDVLLEHIIGGTRLQ